MLQLYCLSVLLELLLFVPVFWKRRQYIIPAITALIGFTSAGLLIAYINLWAVGLLLIAAFRVFNLVRIAKGRMNEMYLYRVTRRTSLWLVMYHFVILAGALVESKWLSNHMIWLVYTASILAASISVLLITLRNIKKTRHAAALEHYADRDLPTVTVAIPARNETQELEDCIRSVLANNYPKLEVIVLDDSSSDKTPEIIRGFAHDGVRFVPGNKPNEHWLAKNQAYEKLAEEASGELILFCGVDVRLGPEAIRSLVTTLLNRNKDMVSVLPQRISGHVSEAFIQPMRYWWELALPRRLFNRPPVLSTCWLIRAKKLKKLGGFGAVSHTVLPEGYFAREAIKTDGYSFIRADELLDIQTRKGWAEQRETAIRTNYPLLRRRPEWVLLITLINILGLLLPFVVALSTLWAGFDAVHLMTLLACVALVITHVSIMQISNPANTLVALFNLPLAALAEMVLGYTSMFQYEFSVVEWKERNITAPVMHTIPKLPDLPS